MYYNKKKFEGLTVGRTHPFELGGGGEREFVGQVSPLVPLFIPLRFVQSQLVRCELIRVVLERVFHSQFVQEGT